jgi:hypothetical protein
VVDLDPIAVAVMLISRPYLVVTTTGEMELCATDQRHAILSGLELLGPGARLIRCSLVDEWVSACAAAPTPAG